MTTATGPRFDDSLASVARTFHVGQWILGALVCAVVVFAWLERRGRTRWARVPCATQKARHGPYRSSDFVSDTLHRAPGLARAASFGSVALTLVFAPLILLALTNYPFDGIAIPLVPGIVLALLNSWCAWLVLARSPHAGSAARSGAVGSLIANVGLLALAALHFVTVELARREGIEHACSSSVTFLVLIFAASSIAQALLTLAALRVHGQALSWGRESVAQP